MRLSDLNIDDYQVVVTPTELKKELPLPEPVRDLVAQSRQTVKDILDGKMIGYLQLSALVRFTIPIWRSNTASA